MEVGFGEGPVHDAGRSVAVDHEGHRRVIGIEGQVGRRRPGAHPGHPEQAAAVAVEEVEGDHDAGVVGPGVLQQIAVVVGRAEVARRRRREEVLDGGPPGDAARLLRALPAPVAGAVVVVEHRLSGGVDHGLQLVQAVDPVHVDRRRARLVVGHHQHESGPRSGRPPPGPEQLHRLVQEARPHQGFEYLGLPQEPSLIGIERHPGPPTPDVGEPAQQLGDPEGGGGCGGGGRGQLQSGRLLGPPVVGDENGQVVVPVLPAAVGPPPRAAGGRASSASRSWCRPAGPGTGGAASTPARARPAVGTASSGWPTRDRTCPRPGTDPATSRSTSLRCHSEITSTP